MELVGLNLAKLRIVFLLQERPSLSLTLSAVNATVLGSP